MANPARELLSIFKEIREFGPADGASVRQMSNMASDKVKALYLRDTAEILDGTVRCIKQLEAQGRRVQKFEAMVPRWTFGVFSYPNGWSQGDVQPLYNEHSMDLLEILADLVDDQLILKEPGFVANLSDLLDEAEQLLKEDDSVSYPLRSYLLQLFLETREALRDEDLNIFDLQEAWKRLYAAFNGAAGQSSERSKWDQFLTKFVWPAAAGAVGSIPGTAVAVAQITMGG